LGESTGRFTTLLLKALRNVTIVKSYTGIVREVYSRLRLPRFKALATFHVPTAPINFTLSSCFIVAVLSLTTA
jgi:hypothetical protein